MKKKNLKNLVLRSHKISNLALLHKSIGGDANTDVDTISIVNTADITIVPECQTKYKSCNFLDCVTNSADTIAPPPSEYEGCLQTGF